MAQIVHIERKKEEDRIICKAGTTRHYQQDPEGGTVIRATVFIGDTLYINLDRSEMKKLRNDLDNLLNDK